MLVDGYYVLQQYRSSLECPFASKCGLAGEKVKFVRGEGDATSGIMFIGRDPGSDENAQGRPFVGMAGRKLRQDIEEVFGSVSDVYLTNLVKCHTPGNRGPDYFEIKRCRAHLHGEILTILPKVVVCLGTEVSEYMLSKGYMSTITKVPMSQMSGKVYRIPLIYKDIDTHIKVIPCYHPSPRNFQYYPDILEAIRRAKQAISEP